MYSTSGLITFGVVVAEDRAAVNGGDSKADLNDPSDTAVSGSGTSGTTDIVVSTSEHLFFFDPCSAVSRELSAVANGFRTSRATFRTTSKFEASFSLGSRYR